MVSAVEWHVQVPWESTGQNEKLPGGIREGFPEAVTFAPGLGG